MATDDSQDNTSKMNGNDLPVIYNINQWIEEYKKFFLPPVCNKMMHNVGQLKVFFVGGPNQRKDYHIEEGEELFYMVTGDMCLKVMEKGQQRDIHIKQGEMFLLSARTPHSPQRQAGTVGLVLERERRENETDGLRYFVEKDGEPTQESLFERWFQCVDLGTQLGPVIKEYFASEQYKTGKPIPGTIPENPPVTVDKEKTLGDPFNLQEWIDKHKAEIENKGVKNLFGEGWQFQVDMYGPGNNEGFSKVAETWIWQIHGSSRVTIGDNDYILNKDDSLLVPVGQRFQSTREKTDARALICVQDPTRKQPWSQ